MSSVDYLRKSVSERLSAAADEIFGDFKRIIVQYEEEILRQRRLLDIVYNPEIRLTRIEPPQQQLCIEEEGEVLAEEQLFNQEKDSCSDQENTKPLLIKEEKVEHKEPHHSTEGEQLELKENVDSFIFNSPLDESEQSEPELKDKTSKTSHKVESEHQRREENKGFGSKSNEEQQETSLNHIDNVHNPKIHPDTPMEKKFFLCDTCGRSFTCQSNLRRHRRIHTGEKPFLCNLCKTGFSDVSVLRRHMFVHTDEKPFFCSTCGKRFREITGLRKHIRIHTGERTHICQTCGKGFFHPSKLVKHMRVHTGERPHPCNTCGKSFYDVSILRRHMSIHTGEKPFICQTCGKAFRQNSYLTVHMSTHSEKREFVCTTCGRDYRHMKSLAYHMKTHKKCCHSVTPGNEDAQ